MDTERITALIDLVADIGIQELEVTDSGESIRIINNAIAFATGTALPIPRQNTTGATSITDNTSLPPEKIIQPTAPVARATTLNAPMSGIFYRAASQGGKPLVEVGMHVENGAGICVIEAMKIMTEVEAQTSGVIDRILCENGDFVERGQALFAIK